MRQSSKKVLQFVLHFFQVNFHITKKPEFVKDSGFLEWELMDSNQ